MASFWLDDSEENELHAIRLLAVEQKPFHRVFKRLTQPDSPVIRRSRHLPTPPPDGDAEVDKDSGKADPEGKVDAAVQADAERQQWREDVKLDFAALESSMVRIQLLQRSNERERERYAAEKIKILETAERIRRSNIELKHQLEVAQKTMEARKTYDVLANKIFSNKLLKSRDEQMQMHEKLLKEIAEQEQEATEYAKAVQARKEQWLAIKDALQGMKVVQHPELQQDDDGDSDNDGDDGDDDAMKGIEGEGAQEEDAEVEDGRDGREGSRPPSRSRSASVASAARDQSRGPDDQVDESAGEGVDTLKPVPKDHTASGPPSPAPQIEGMKIEGALIEETHSHPTDNVEEGEASDSNDLMED